MVSLPPRSAIVRATFRIRSSHPGGEAELLEGAVEHGAAGVVHRAPAPEVLRTHGGVDRGGSGGAEALLLEETRRGRLEDSVTEEQAQAEMSAIARSLGAWPPAKPPFLPRSALPRQRRSTITSGNAPLTIVEPAVTIVEEPLTFVE